MLDRHQKVAIKRNKEQDIAMQSKLANLYFWVFFSFLPRALLFAKSLHNYPPQFEHIFLSYAKKKTQISWEKSDHVIQTCKQ